MCGDFGPCIDVTFLLSGCYIDVSAACVDAGSLDTNRVAAFDI